MHFCALCQRWVDPKQSDESATSRSVARLSLSHMMPKSEQFNQAGTLRATKLKSPGSKQYLAYSKATGQIVNLTKGHGFIFCETCEVSGRNKH
jgi:hypothetical protein